MPSIFEELGVVDRPWVPVTITLKGKSFDLVARKPSGAEQDALDAYFMDRYGAIVYQKTRAKEGEAESEMDRIRNIYRTRPKSDIVDQLIPTRSSDIMARAYELSGVDPGAEQLNISAIEDPQERLDYAKDLDKKVESFKKEAEAEVRAVLMAEELNSLVESLSQININVQAQMLARRSVNAHFLYYTLYTVNEDGSADARVFKTPDQVMDEFQGDTVNALALEVKSKLEAADDLPFELPPESTPEKPASSPPTTAAASPRSGKRSGPRQKNSKSPSKQPS